ncbi:hypothetical protein ABK905_13705 [Acerihabitans sp. KWT182]|uniref:DUF222 domain-containing protein n=1 Tax=Acerihabitans sp. KWT182 TaxID=3157919 RepID=A0AAU7Q4C8_9GAMM
MIQIEAEALQRLLALQQQLTDPCAGLRIRLEGDGCQGWRAILEWARRQREEDYPVRYQGLILLAAIAHWPYLQRAVIQAGVLDREPGVWIELQLQASACHCDNQVCASPQTAL